MDSTPFGETNHHIGPRSFGRKWAKAHLIAKPVLKSYSQNI